jgi:DNA-binding LacI/PurR family transcriptional regulator
VNLQTGAQANLPLTEGEDMPAKGTPTPEIRVLTRPLVFRPWRVADQAADSLRSAIQKGVLGEFLPGEFELARQMGIGRSTIRAALKQLEISGLVEIRRGSRCRIRGNGAASPATAPHALCLVTSINREPLHTGLHPAIGMLHAQFSDSGGAWEQLIISHIRTRADQRLSQIVPTRRGVCWMLFGVSAHTQRWFEESGEPTLIFGHAYPGIKLPSIDVDYQAIGWHAARGLEQIGHRRILCVMPAPVCGGDIACRAGIQEYVQKFGRGLSVTEIDDNGSMTALMARVERLLREKNRPTAILSLIPANTVFITMNLLKSHWNIPGDISVIAAVSDDLVDRALPGLTRYTVDVVKVARRVVRVTHSIMAGNSVPPRPSLIVPKFIPGETLGPPPGRAVNRPAGSDSG